MPENKPQNIAEKLSLDNLPLNLQNFLPRLEALKLPSLPKVEIPKLSVNPVETSAELIYVPLAALVFAILALLGRSSR
jgi:hypothetical protein